MRLAFMRRHMQFDQLLLLAQKVSLSGAGPSMPYNWYLCCGRHIQHDCLAKLGAIPRLHELI